MSKFKILLPLDGSRLAEHSLAYLDALRSLGDVQGRLVGVVVENLEPPRDMAPEEAIARETNLLSTYLREVSTDVEEHLGLKLETKVLRGTAAAAILDDASAYQPDLIVISTHGRSGISRWRLGSVADKVIRGAARNTLVVGPKATDQEQWFEARLIEPFESILLPTDGSDLAEQAIDVARNFAQKFGATVHIVRAVPIPTPAIGYGAEAAYIPDLLDQLVEGAWANVNDVRSHFGGIEVKTEVLVGPAASELEDYVRKEGIGLVVMTSHGRGGFVRTALGSVTDRMLASGSAPVLVVRHAVEAGEMTSTQPARVSN